ncbi:MAG: four-carbon acid sugar kinase family protein [Marinovum sp.]|nr:four-carbon acid sugar kinase family protein [Marinovum sp.]
MKLGCIGDDFTGSSDLANTLAKAGMRTVQYTGIPSVPAAPDIEAGVVSLKSRSSPVGDAIAQSLAALDWLLAQGCTQIFFKYCSTFDSAPEGNIGPVADALADRLGADRVIVCPAFPGTGRSLYQGHLFVKDTLLSESGMETHPLTPMTDPDIRRWLRHQTSNGVGHVNVHDVFAGAQAIKAGLDRVHGNGQRFAVVDALKDSDLMEIGAAATDLKLITGGSGVAMGLPRNFGCTPGTATWHGQSGPSLMISGSCSLATQGQVAYHAARYPSLALDVGAIIAGKTTPDAALGWALNAGGRPLIYSSAAPEEVAETQERFGRDAAATVIEDFFAKLAQAAVAKGVLRIIIAGGETSGAVVEALDLTSLEIGPEIDPGVPALRASPNLVLALKSGNFGSEDFFEKADGVLST